MIQNAAKENYFQLFPEELLASILDAFVINRPMNGEVGGDGFWVHQTSENLFVVAFDCMGHGYGASMMTRMYTQALEKTVVDLAMTDPSEILTAIHEHIKAHFESRPKTYVGSGADMGILRISKSKKELAFAGAKTDLYCVAKGTCETVKADRMQLGELFDYPRSYSTHVIKPDESDPTNFYMASDGLADLIGGPESKKFGRKQMRAMLAELSDQTMAAQKKLIATQLDEWSGDQEPLDDLLVIGFRI